MRQLCTVYRSAESDYDCTNGGVSVRFARFLVISEDEPLPDDPMFDARTPVCILSRSTPTHPVIKPHPALLRGGVAGWTMFGGNFASTSDSRFLDAVEAICGSRWRAVPIHDRQE